MEVTISAERLSSILGLIYDSAIDPERWPVAMEAIRIELNFDNATLELIELPSCRAISLGVCNIPERYRAVMQGAGPDVIDQWGGQENARRLPLNKPAVLSRANPAFNPVTTTNRYFAAFGRPQGLIDVMAIGLARDARGLGTMSFGRHGSAGPIGEREVAVAELLIPHLQRAATLNRLIDGLSTAQAAFSSTIDALSVPVIVVGAACNMIHANPAAKGLLEAKHLVRLEGGVLQATTPAASQALLAAVMALSDQSKIDRPSLGIPIIAADGSSGALQVIPLTRDRRLENPKAVAAIFVARVNATFVSPTEMAAALFNLTPTEARVFEHIVTGRTQDETAADLGVQRSTVKSHLLRLYDKVGVRRQAELVQVAASLAVPVAL